MVSEKKRVIITTVDEEGKKLKLVLRSLGHKLLQEAQMVYNVSLTGMIKRSVSEDAQLLSRQQLEQHLSDLGIWTEKDARQFLELQMELRELEFKLLQGGVKVEEGKKMALQMKIKRSLLLILYNRRSQFDSITMEAIADNEKFKFLITKCILLAETDKPFFRNVDDYENRQNEKAAIDAATALAGYIYGYDKDTESNLVENKWLAEFKFADNQGRLINEDGKLVDASGSLVNEDGRYVNKQGELIDTQGRAVDEDGNFVVKTKPFTDGVSKAKPKKPRKKKQKVV